jgi:hypothetical protein
LEGISARGGFKDFADKNKITILRDGKPLYIERNGKKTQYFKYSDMISGKHPESNFAPGQRSRHRELTRHAPRRKSEDRQFYGSSTKLR